MVGRDQSTQKYLSKGFGKVLPQQWTVCELWTGGLMMMSLRCGSGKGGNCVCGTMLYCTYMVLTSVPGA